MSLLWGSDRLVRKKWIYLLLCKMFLFWLKIPVENYFRIIVVVQIHPLSLSRITFKCLWYGLFCDMDKGKGSVFLTFLSNAPLRKIPCLCKAQIVLWLVFFSLRNRCLMPLFNCGSVLQSLAWESNGSVILLSEKHYRG